MFGNCADGIHKFEPRYDKEPAERGFDRIRASGQELKDFLEAHLKITYVRDVCARCGKTIERT